jgi:hypothetical protein
MRKNREVTGNKKVFRVHLGKDVNEILFKNRSDLGRFGVILDNHLPFIKKISLKNVGVVALMHFAGLSVCRQCYRCRFVMSSALIAPGAGVASFWMCHCSVCSLSRFAGAVYSSL